MRGAERGAEELANEVLSGLGARWVDAFVQIEDMEVHNESMSSGASDYPGFTRRVMHS